MITWIKNLFQRYPEMVLDEYRIVARDDSFTIHGNGHEFIFPYHVDVETCKVEWLTIIIKDGKMDIFCMNHIKISGFHNPHVTKLNKIRRKKD